MKLKDVEDHSLAAFYLNTRSTMREGSPTEPLFTVKEAIDRARSSVLKRETLQADVDTAELLLELHIQAHGSIAPLGEADLLAERASLELKLRLAKQALPVAYVRCTTGKPHVGSWCKGGTYFLDNPLEYDFLFRNVVHRETGYYDNPHGEAWGSGKHVLDGVVKGVVATLRARKGESRYVAGYEHGGHDGVVFDLSHIHTSRFAAEHDADAMAERVAEVECEYQSAYEAGKEFGEAATEIVELRREMLAALKENRESGGSRDMPKLHQMLLDSAVAVREKISELREEQHSLESGAHGPYYFFWNDEIANAFYDGVQSI